MSSWLSALLRLASSWLVWLVFTPSISSSMVDMMKLVSTRSGDLSLRRRIWWFSLPGARRDSLGRKGGRGADWR
jgi:hypothetical protein